MELKIPDKDRFTSDMISITGNACMLIAEIRGCDYIAPCSSCAFYQGHKHLLVDTLLKVGKIDKEEAMKMRLEHNI